MIYLTKLPLNPRSRQVQSEVRNPYEMHRTLSRAFKDDPDSYASARVLFRVDESGTGCGVAALVQTALPPDWSEMESHKDYLAGDVVVKEFAPVFRVNQRLAFRLRANPTVKRDGKRLGLYGEAECTAWLGRKAEEGGFKVADVVTHHPEKLKCRTAEGRDTTLSSVLFNGTLVVCDPERLIETVRTGVGAAKGFGFGLLSLARA